MALPQHTTCGLHPKNLSILFPYHLCLSTPHAACIIFQGVHNCVIQLCLSTPHAACIAAASATGSSVYPLPQHTTCGLHQDHHRRPPLELCLCLSTPHAACIVGAGHVQAPVGLCLSTPHAACIYKGDTVMISVDLCLSTPHAACIGQCAGAHQYQPLCLSTPHAACIFRFTCGIVGPVTLPQHTTCGLHLQVPVELGADEGLCLSTPHAACIQRKRSSGTWRNFASAHHMRLASAFAYIPPGMRCFASAHHMRLASFPPSGPLCRSFALPQHTTCGLHRQRCTDIMPHFYGVCRELVDSFSDTV